MFNLVLCSTICGTETRLQDLFRFLGSCSTNCGTVPLCVGLLGYCPNGLSYQKCYSPSSRLYWAWLFPISSFFWASTAVYCFCAIPISRFSLLTRSAAPALLWVQHAIRTLLNLRKENLEKFSHWLRLFKDSPSVGRCPSTNYYIGPPTLYIYIHLKR